MGHTGTASQNRVSTELSSHLAWSVEMQVRVLDWSPYSFGFFIHVVEHGVHSPHGPNSIAASQGGREGHGISLVNTSGLQTVSSSLSSLNFS